MSLLNLVHKNVIIKFADAAKSQFNPEASYVFRLVGVDAMGFLLIQELKPDDHAGHETASEPYWINKDLIREIRELDLAKAIPHDNGETANPQPPTQIDPARQEATPKATRARSRSSKSLS